MTVLENFTFFKDADATGDSPALKNIHGEALVLCVSGTFTGAITISGKQGDVDTQLTVVDLSDASVKDTITAAGTYAILCAYGFEEFVATISALTAGSITVTGRLCAG